MDSNLDSSSATTSMLTRQPESHIDSTQLTNLDSRIHPGNSFGGEQIAGGKGSEALKHGLNNGTAVFNNAGAILPELGVTIV